MKIVSEAFAKTKLCPLGISASAYTRDRPKCTGSDCLAWESVAKREVNVGEHVTKDVPYAEPHGKCTAI